MEGVLPKGRLLPHHIVAGAMATATLGSMRCDAQTTRRIVERETGQIKNMDLDKLDNCGEVTLGLGATFGCTIAIWILGLNFFDMVVLSWVRTWEPLQFDFFKEPILGSFPADGDGVPQGAFVAMDSDNTGFASQAELKNFLTHLDHPNLREHEVSYAFKGMDMNKDEQLSSTEWINAFVHNTFWYQDTTTTTTLATTLATTPAPKIVPQPVPQPFDEDKVRKGLSTLMQKLGKNGQRGAEQAFWDLDLNNDGFSAPGEMTKAVSKLPISTGVSPSDLLRGMDINEDAVLSFPEFKKAFQDAQSHEPSPSSDGEVVHVKVGQPGQGQKYTNPRGAKVLKEMGLSEPPLTMQRFADGMGAVPPQTAFKALDSNQDNEISEEEMVRFAKAFVPPLTEQQAQFAFRGMDINDNGRVVPAEMYDTLSFGDFFPSEQQAREMHQ